jgi:hypothetical protein
MPLAVRDEMSAQAAPPVIRNWIANPPVWLEVRAATQMDITARANDEISVNRRKVVWRRSRGYSPNVWRGVGT